MRQTQSRRSHPQRRDEYGRFTESDGRRTPRSRSDYQEEDNYRDDWDYDTEDYDSEQPYAEDDDYGREEYAGEYREEEYDDYESGRGSRGGSRGFTSSEGRSSHDVGRVSSRRANGRRRTNENDRRTTSRSRVTSSSRSRGSSRGGGRGFASMSQSEVRRIASMGGRASHGSGRSSRSRRRSSR